MFSPSKMAPPLAAAAYRIYKAKVLKAAASRERVFLMSFWEWFGKHYAAALA